MTTFEWGMLSVAVAGLLFTGGGLIAGCVWTVARIKEETDDRVDKEREYTAKLLADHIDAQERNTGELGLALRRHIENVERKIGEVEIWGRDNYALKDDVKESISELRNDIRTFGTDIRADIRTLSAKVDSKH